MLLYIPKAELSAIYYLHQIITLSPVMIRQIFGLFGITIEIERILRISTEWDEEQFMLNYSRINHKASHTIDEETGDEMIHVECSPDVIPTELTIEEEPRDDVSDKPICEGNSLEFHRKYKGYINFYSNPW